MIAKYCMQMGLLIAIGSLGGGGEGIGGCAQDMWGGGKALF